MNLFLLLRAHVPQEKKIIEYYMKTILFKRLRNVVLIQILSEEMWC